MVYTTQVSPLIRIDWSGCLPQECVPENNELVDWITSILSENAVKTLNSTIKLENERVYCEGGMTYDSGAYVGTIYLSVVAILVLSGNHMLI